MTMDNLAYQEDWTEERIGGRFVAMSPASTNHNRIAGNIYRLFANYLHGKTCVPFADNEYVFLSDDDIFVPDFMIVCDRSRIQKDGVHGAPDLVVEILSPSTARIDKGHKKDAYAKAGVREYWIVSPSEKSVEVYRRDGGGLALYDVYTARSEWVFSGLRPLKPAAVTTRFRCSLYEDFEISLDDIFYDLFP